MPLNRIPCPECGAGLKSSSGFTVGQNVCCPKCETYFAVEKPTEEEDIEENDGPKKAKPTLNSSKAKAAGKKPLKAATLPDDDEDEYDDDRPIKKKKKKKRQDDDDQERSYKNSPIRFAILGVLIIAMLVLGYFLYDKKMKERDADKETASTDSGNTSGPNIPKDPNFVPVMPKKGGPFVPVGKGPIQPFPKDRLPVPKDKTNGFVGTGGFLSPNPLTEPEKKQFLEKYKAQLIGTWKADLGGGTTVQLVYDANGKASGTITSPKGTKSFMSTWSTNGSVSRKGLTVIAFAGSGFTGASKPLELIFEDDELQHPVFDPVLDQMVIGIFRKA